MSTANNPAISIFRILIVLAMIAAAVFLLIRVPKLIFNDPVAKGQPQCAKDVAYFYKDPHNHPYDC